MKTSLPSYTELLELSKADMLEAAPSLSAYPPYSLVEMADSIRQSLARQLKRFQQMEIESAKPRFGRLVRRLGLDGGFGELRRQKKKPHTEVLYIWTFVTEYDMALRSIQSLTVYQLAETISRVGYHLEERVLSQIDAEFMLDVLYAQLARKTKCET